jgi:Fur family ferric uptake transcriptional regulator
MDPKGYRFHLQRLKTAGQKITAARKNILHILCDSAEHLGSKEILQRVSRLDEQISRASVFRTIELFLKLSIIRPTVSQSGVPRFVLTEDNGHHAHLTCPYCMKTTELEECYVPGVEEKILKKYGRVVSGHLLEIYSYCADCLKDEQLDGISGQGYIET